MPARRWRVSNLRLAVSNHNLRRYGDAHRLPPITPSATPPIGGRPGPGPEILPQLPT